MKNNLWILLAVALLVIIVLASIFYPQLAENYTMPEEELPPSVTTVPGAETAVPTQTPDFTVYDADMQEVKLSSFFGKPIVVNFWATWCGPCISELPAFDAAYAKYGDDVVFLMVNLTDGFQETVEGVKAFAADNGYTFPVYYDTRYDASNTYGVYSIPVTLFITADGQLYESKIGAMNEAALEKRIQAILPPDAAQ